MYIIRVRKKHSRVATHVNTTNKKFHTTTDYPKKHTSSTPNLHGATSSYAFIYDKASTKNRKIPCLSSRPATFFPPELIVSNRRQIRRNARTHRATQVPSYHSKQARVYNSVYKRVLKTARRTGRASTSLFCGSLKGTVGFSKAAAEKGTCSSRTVSPLGGTRAEFPATLREISTDAPISWASIFTEPNRTRRALL